jgi:hypothetical protein
MAIRVSRILHAGYLFEKGQTRILFDPIFENPFSRNCYAFPEVRFETDTIQELDFSAVFISHYHDDHCSFESLNLIKRGTPIYMYCVFDEMFSLLRELGFQHVIPLELGISVKVGEFEIIPRRALDSDVDCLFHVRFESLNILNVVDSWIDELTMEELAKIRWDLVMWPFQTMRELEVMAPGLAESASELPAEWIEQLKLLQPRFLVPSSCQFQFEPWSWYNKAFFSISYGMFSREMKKILTSTQIIRMNPGTSFFLSPEGIQQTERLHWVKPVGEQNLDYEFDPKPMPTIEIARALGGLSDIGKKRIENFCQEVLPAKYANLPLPESPYLQQPLVWQLKLYDHQGLEFQYFYKLNQQKAELLKGTTQSVGWKTEIPAVKLLAALDEGESLTSLYVRINEGLEEKVRGKIELFEIVEDPLLRCLFSGVFGSYQKAQLAECNLRKKQFKTISSIE